MSASDSSLFNKDYFLRLFVILVSPIPYYDSVITMTAMSEDKKSFINVYYLLSDFILVFMFFRVIFLTRAISNYSVFMDRYSKKICKTYGVTNRNAFAFKCFVNSRPITTIGIILVGSVLLLAFALRIFELPYSVAIGSVVWYRYFDSCWFTVVTMTTVGYGDATPVTICGRMVGIVTMCWGNFLIALLISSLSGLFNLNQDETQAMDHLMKTRSAARSITYFMRFLHAKKHSTLGAPTTKAQGESLVEQRADVKEVLMCERDMHVQLQHFKTLKSDLNRKNLDENKRTQTIDLIKS